MAEIRVGTRLSEHQAPGAFQRVGRVHTEKHRFLHGCDARF